MLLWTKSNLKSKWSASTNQFTGELGGVNFYVSQCYQQFYDAWLEK